VRTTLKIKICGLTQPDNIASVSALKPDLEGFIFYPASPRYMEDKLKPEDILSIPGNIKKTGVFVNADFYEIYGIHWKYNLDFVQLHGDEGPNLCRQLHESGMEIIKAFSLHEGFDFGKLTDYIDSCRYFLFDTQTQLRGGSGRKFNWEIIRDYNLGHPFFLSGGIGPHDVEEVKKIGHPSLAGVDVNSRFETEPGIKDVSRLEKFINEIRST